MIDRENERHKKVMSLLRMLTSELSFISNVEPNNMMGGTCDTLDDINKKLHQLRKVFGNYKLAEYRGSMFKELLLYYRFEDYDFKVSFYCKDMEHALETVSDGRCKVVEGYSKPWKNYDVVCDL